MLTVTVKKFESFGPCWLEDAEGRKKLRLLAAIRNEWTALDILRLPDVSVADKLWSVLREEFIPAPVLHEFGCWCAEQALALIDNPDPRSVAAIAAKRAWLQGEITDEQLASARAAACAAACVAACAAAWDDARAAACAAARDAACAAAWAAAENAQIAHLIEMLEVAP